MAWHTNGPITDPGDGEVLADSGALAVGSTTAALLIYAPTACTVYLNHRNALNTATLHSQPIPITGNVFAPIIGIPLSPAMNERYTLTLDVGFTGVIWASILTG